MSNVEGMYSVYFKKRLSKAKPPFDIPVFRSRLQRDSIFDILRFTVPDI